MLERLRTALEPDSESRPRVSFEDDGIVRVDYSPCERVTLSAVRYAHEWRMANGPAHKVPALLVGGRVGSVEYDAQRFASSPEVCAATSAVAIVVKSFLERHLARLFLVYHRPPYPTQVFSDEILARNWLRGFVHDRQEPQP